MKTLLIALAFLPIMAWGQQRQFHVRATGDNYFYWVEFTNDNWKKTEYIGIFNGHGYGKRDFLIGYGEIPKCIEFAKTLKTYQNCLDWNKHQYQIYLKWKSSLNIY